MSTGKETTVRSLANLTKEEYAEYWQMVLDEFQDSGLTKTAYCQENEISVSTFNYWENRLRELQENSAEPHSLMQIIKNEFELNPFESGNIFLFCGSRSHVIKALVFEKDGFVLLTKRLIRGHFQWPRNAKEVLEISEEQYHKLMDGFAVEYRSTIEKINHLEL